MIQPFDSIKFSEYIVVTLFMHLLTVLKFIKLVTDLCWSQLQKLFPKLFQASSHHHRHDYAEADGEEHRPSPSLGPVPLTSHAMSTLIKTKLPVIEFKRSDMQGTGEEESSSVVCAICLACINGSEEIRELVNFSHLYHKDCVDGWIDHGHLTCPLYRLKLLPCQADHGEKDPWRLERIASAS